MRTIIYLIPFYGLFKSMKMEGHWFTEDGFPLIALYNLSILSGILVLVLKLL